MSRKIKGKQGYKKQKKQVSGYSYFRNGKWITVSDYTREQWVKERKKEKRKQIEERVKQKGKRLKTLNPEKKPLKDLTDVEIEDMTKKELKELMEKFNIELGWDNSWRGHINSVKKARDKARMKDDIKNNLNWHQLESLIDYFDLWDLTEEYKVKSYKEALLSTLTLENYKQYEKARGEVKGLTNKEKYALRLLNEDYGALPKSRLEKIIGKPTIESLLNKELIDTNYFSGYYRTRAGEMVYHFNKREFEELESPEFKMTERELKPYLIETVTSLGKAKKEYSIGIDFERELEQPERIVGIQGGTDFTFKLNEDFEMYGHTHPDREVAKPSKKDLLSLEPGRPEFIVAGETGDAIIMEIGNENAYRFWKKFPSYWSSQYDFSTAEDINRFYRNTGIKITPYRKGMKIRMIDDPRREKSFPFYTTSQLERISKDTLEGD
jgi:hypothetical protein